MKKQLLVILGGGESGVGAALLAHQQHYEVWVSDAHALLPEHKQTLEQHQIAFEEKQHSLDIILKAHAIIKSPGIADSTPVVQEIRKHGIEVLSEIEFAYRFKGDSKIIAVTGTNGKTPTTSLIYHICCEAGLDCALVGNIGYSFARQVATAPKPLYILEVSSFQLDDVYLFHAYACVLLNISANHLDRYNNDIQAYIASKLKIGSNQTAADYFIYCLDDKNMAAHLPTATAATRLPFSAESSFLPGAFLNQHTLTMQINEEEKIEMNIDDFKIKGKQNLYNSMAAGIAAKTLHIRNEKIKAALASFEGLPHRQEFVATVRGVDFVNDSKSTNVNSTWFALENAQKPTILILGGIDKGNDYAVLENMIAKKVKAIVCLGTDNLKIKNAFAHLQIPIEETQTAIEAVQKAYNIASKGDLVLLSPACSSFDLFAGYEDRGAQYKQAVLNL